MTVDKMSIGKMTKQNCRQSDCKQNCKQNDCKKRKQNDSKNCKQNDCRQMIVDKIPGD